MYTARIHFMQTEILPPEFRTIWIICFESVFEIILLDLYNHLNQAMAGIVGT